MTGKHVRPLKLEGSVNVIMESDYWPNLSCVVPVKLANRADLEAHVYTSHFSCDGHDLFCDNVEVVSACADRADPNC